ncbi:MAG: right-handed parallel beta-helix repeat-containing protein [Candidatus Eisenbacteria sp.]|nr:right-handed parallel beta-helix repeat-containing protein [Candidatus Eisenbacteria bacterium]
MPDLSHKRQLAGMGVALGVLIALASVPSLAAGKALIVTPRGDGDFPSIQAAIDAAAPGDTVLLTNGTFSGSGNRDISFLGKSIVVRSASDVPESCVVDCQRQGQGFCFYWEEPAAAVLRGVTITKSDLDGHGGAIYCNAASPTIELCIITRNQATRGGGIYCGEGSAPHFTDCRIVENTTEMVPTPGVGGAMLSSYSAPVFERCAIEGNTSGGPGGGLYCSSGSLTLRECTIRGNGESGVLVSYGTSLLVENCVFSGNDIGAVDCHQATATIISSTIAANISSIYSAGIHCRGGSSIALRQTVLWGNCGPAETSQILVEDGSSVEMECCLVDTSGVGGEGTVTYVGEQVCADPLFCDPPPCGDDPTTAGEFTLYNLSPCLPERNPCGVLIGAAGRGCQLTPPAQETSWGRLKAAFGTPAGE